MSSVFRCGGAQTTSFQRIYRNELDKNLFQKKAGLAFKRLNDANWTDDQTRKLMVGFIGSCLIGNMTARDEFNQIDFSLKDAARYLVANERSRWGLSRDLTAGAIAALIVICISKEVRQDGIQVPLMKEQIAHNIRCCGEMLSNGDKAFLIDQIHSLKPEKFTKNHYLQDTDANSPPMFSPLVGESGPGERSSFEQHVGDSMFIGADTSQQAITATATPDSTPENSLITQEEESSKQSTADTSQQTITTTATPASTPENSLITQEEESSKQSTKKSNANKETNPTINHTPVNLVACSVDFGKYNYNIHMLENSHHPSIFVMEDKDFVDMIKNPLVQSECSTGVIQLNGSGGKTGTRHCTLAAIGKESGDLSYKVIDVSDIPLPLTNLSGQIYNKLKTCDGRGWQSLPSLNPANDFSMLLHKYFKNTMLLVSQEQHDALRNSQVGSKNKQLEKLRDHVRYGVYNIQLVVKQSAITTATSPNDPNLIVENKEDKPQHVVVLNTVEGDNPIEGDNPDGDDHQYYLSLNYSEAEDRGADFNKAQGIVEDGEV